MRALRHGLLILALGLGGAALAAAAAGQAGGGQEHLPPPQAPTGPVPGPNPPPDDRPGPYTGNAVGTVDGRKLFVRYNCSGCHGGRAGGGMGPSLRDQDWIYGSSDADVFDSIAQGRAHGMPAWGTRLPDDQIWKLVAYIRSLRTQGEPDAPGQ
jgi:cytochrome c oxidase cbb3-type subunit III